MCPTYPRIFAVPARISDAVLFHAAKFRSRGRIPVLSFIYPYNGTSITRSSQPLVGIKSKRSIQDEKLIEAIFDSHITTSATSSGSAGNVASSSPYGSQSALPASSVVDNAEKRNVIIDARPLGNAMANRAMGAGTESLENYKNCQRLFMGIDNIHVMRDSLFKLLDGMQGSGWYQFAVSSP